MKTLELTYAGMQELSHEEMTEVEGGGLIDLIIGILIEHADDFVRGVQDGFNGK